MGQMGPIINQDGINRTTEEVRDVMLTEFAMIEIFFSEVAFEKLVSHPAYLPLALLCDIGGAMGLILGSTLLTMFEVVDFVMVTCWHAYLTKKVRVSSKT